MISRQPLRGGAKMRGRPTHLRLVDGRFKLLGRERRPDFDRHRFAQLLRLGSCHSQADMSGGMSPKQPQGNQ